MKQILANFPKLGKNPKVRQVRACRKPRNSGLRSLARALQCRCMTELSPLTPDLSAPPAARKASITPTAGLPGRVTSGRLPGRKAPSNRARNYPTGAPAGAFPARNLSTGKPNRLDSEVKSFVLSQNLFRTGAMP
jgi:hypothetical protein